MSSTRTPKRCEAASVLLAFYRNCSHLHCRVWPPQMVLVYDSSRPDSFESLSTWLDESRHYGAVGLPSVLLANKVRTAGLSPSQSPLTCFRPCSYRLTRGRA